MYLSPRRLRLLSGGASLFGNFLFIVTPIVAVCNCSMFCCSLLYAHSSIAIILMGKRELVVLLNLSSRCLVMVEWLFLAVKWDCLRFVIVVFPDHIYLLFVKAPEMMVWTAPTGISDIICSSSWKKSLIVNLRILYITTKENLNWGTCLGDNTVIRCSMFRFDNEYCFISHP